MLAFILKSFSVSDFKFPSPSPGNIKITKQALFHPYLWQKNGGKELKW